jgi:transcriptional regulator with XRE-family HTH domain
MGLTRTQLAAALSLSESMIGQYERGDYPVPRVVQLALETLTRRHKDGKPILNF